MEKYKNLAIKRAQNVIFCDKLMGPANFQKAIKLEIFSALSQFMNISEEDIKLVITLQKNGIYDFSFSVKTASINPVGMLAK